MNVLLTGGLGYKGRVLLPKLITAGHDVTVWDTGYFHHGPMPEGCRVILGDIRQPEAVRFGEYDAIIHLAGIANDPCGELDAKLTWEVNVLAHMRIMDAAAMAKRVKQFIYASSASVYGIQGNKPVTEDSPLAPVSDYNKTKMCAERISMSYADSMNVQIVRPATICGLSPRMRLDVVVNMLTSMAVTRGYIEVKTPDLYRPHCHIEDVTDLYLQLLANPYCHGPYNAGFENQTIMDTAKLIAEYTGCEIRTAPHVPGPLDKRSYLVDSDRLKRTTFSPKYGVKDAVKDIVDAFRTGKLKNEQIHHNLAWMRQHDWVSATR